MDRRNGKAVILLAVAVLTLYAGVFGARAVEKLLYPRKYSSSVERWCAEYEVNESLAYAIIRTESSFRPDAVSSTGALGLMQIMPETFEWLKTKTGEEHLPAEALLSPDINIRYGVLLLSILEKEFGSDRMVIAAYHAGIGSVSKWMDGGLTEDSEPSEFPSGATGHYVRKVEKARRIYIKLYY